ncbi:hypothetical protein BO78DRAFT_415818 [Aspergillus sclerotiicarbonarius CBS 121057]|uniref:Uncharacterized protein n=1 Tax=Aspergillus sclerotiicarbonarius (strain CBS 121057 / IBT 28362) TaxID=1448318 RepID=A0A319EQU4_ASPSB|nr:hypothetical protein BO78DRAFT_415818 [Aspergillus sclerotiicarbonarius CBS 121057]
MFLVKDCISRSFTNPFRYLVLDPNTEPGTLEGIQTGPTEFGKQLHTLHQNIHQTGQGFIHPWRLWTARFSNPMASIYDPHEEKTSDFSKQMRSHRARMVDIMFQQVSTDDELYEKAVQLSIDISTHVEYLEFRTLKDIEPMFHRSSEDIRASTWHHLKSDDGLDGHRILAMNFPVVYVGDDMCHTPYKKKPLVKGIVFVESDKD